MPHKLAYEMQRSCMSFRVIPDLLRQGTSSEENKGDLDREGQHIVGVKVGTSRALGVVAHGSEDSSTGNGY